MNPVVWKELPRFELVIDGEFDHFLCVETGRLEWNEFKPSDQCTTVHFPAGWKTDVTSSPLWIRWAVPQLGRHSPAALAHDVALDMGWPRRRARLLMYDALKSLDKPVSKFRIFVMYYGVALYDILSVAGLAKKKGLSQKLSP